MESVQIIAFLLQGSQVISALVPITLEVALKLKEIFSKGGNEFEIEIKGFQDGAVLAADETLALIDAWKKANGYE
jgi:hypothetical protein